MRTSNVREWTCRVLEAMDEGLLDPKQVAEMCLSAMSEDDVEYMCKANELKEYLSPEAEDEDEDEDYDPMDDFNYVGSRHHY